MDTVRREAFYWAAVVATFAMGTALGDLTATTFGMRYFPAAGLFLVQRLDTGAGGRVIRGIEYIGCDEDTETVPQTVTNAAWV